uniref:Ribosomal protein L34 n=1 Tax=Dasya naccarioides TaxID=2007180 RepID=A0A1Z1MGF0_9FLOR|nr:ribosomal protein L34 [Dasya naccarioides]ARW65083.1 ribosomal protein L34 [Dasya naccarioides]
MNKGTKRKRLRKSGFRSRIKTASGKRIIKEKRKKKRYSINLL